MKPRLLAIPAYLTVLAVLSTGCGFKLFGWGERGGKTRKVGYDKEYIRYTGPLQVGRSYEYKTVEQNTFTEVGGDYDPAVHPDGTRLIFASTYHDRIPEIYMKTTRGATVTRLTNSSWAEIQPCFSPDGKSFAYASNRRGNWDICIRRLDGSRDVRPITHSMKTDEIAPCFHPTRPWIVFSTFSTREGKWVIAAKHLKTGQLRYLGQGLYPKFSPDGSKIAFQRARTRSPRWYSIWTIDVDEDLNATNATEVVSSPKWAAINPNWSPKGRYLVFATVHESALAQHTRRVLSGDDIWIVNLEGQDLIKLTETEEPESHPVWSRDAAGKDRIYFCSMMKGPRNIWSLTPRLPQPYGSVRGKLPGPPERNPVPRVRRDEAGVDRPGSLDTYVAPPPPATGRSIPN